jgi:hypothetical protein
MLLAAVQVELQGLKDAGAAPGAVCAIALSVNATAIKEM